MSHDTQDIPLVQMYNLGHLSEEQYGNICADYAEEVEAGNVTWDQVADAMFGPDPYNNR